MGAGTDLGSSERRIGLGASLSASTLTLIFGTVILLSESDTERILGQVERFDPLDLDVRGPSRP